MTSSPPIPARAEPAAPPLRLPVGILLTGLLGALLVVGGAVGAGGVPVADPVLGDGPLSVLRYGHGHDLAVAVVYGGVGLLVWAWVRLGRAVLAGRAQGRAVLACSGAWMVPMLVAPPLFTRDAYSYLAQGALALGGFDPYAVGPEVMDGSITDNVHSLWLATPAPYGPLFILLAKGVAALVGGALVSGGLISGVVLMRLVLLPGLALLVWALPGLTRHLGGRISVTLWLVVANPLTVVQLVGGPHNDVLMIGLLAAGTLLVLERRHAAGVGLAALAVAVKATAGIALPFLVLVWAARLPGRRRARLAVAGAATAVIVLAVYLAADLALGVGAVELPALGAPSLIVNWLSLPTGLGELAHGALGWLLGADEQPFVRVARVLGLLALLAVTARQCWLARDGGPEAVRRCAGVLLLTAALGPAALPWYFSWGLALAAGLPWRRTWLAVAVGASVALMLVDYPSGEGAYTNWPFLLAGAGLCVLTGVSLLRPDPLGLSRPRVPADAT